MAKKKTQKTKQKKTKQVSKRSIFAKTLKWGFVLTLWVCIIMGCILAWYARELPTITKDMVFERRPTIIIKASDGTILDRYGDIKGESLAIAELPSHLIYAVLAIEDRRFYDHFGLDIVGIGRAFFVNVKQGGFVQGGSTITQQLAKNLFLSRDRTLKRKIQEAMLAIWLEQKLTKDEILSAYLNRVYLGSGAYGIDAAAKVYFNKSAKSLTLREAATLAGLLKAPSRYAPSSNPSLAAQRTRVVLNSMVEAGFIGQDAIDDIKTLPPSPRKKPSSGETVRYFSDYVVGQMNDLVGPVSRDLIVETTLDPNIQAESEAATTRALLAHGTARKFDQGAALILRLDGSIAAMVGGRDYGLSQFNRITHSYRSPGSSFKPIVYLTALEQGWQPDDLILDAPIEEGDYRPQNFGDEYYGEITLFEALTLSLNTVAFRLINSVGPDSVVNMARRLGITSELLPTPSLALGSYGISMMEMATVYVAFARKGLAVDTFAITKISDEDGNVYYEHPKRQSARQVINRQNVEDLTDMMVSVVENGTGKAAQFGPRAAGKTGTSQDFRDAWFIGFTDQYVGAVWFGNDDNTPTKRVTGGFTPALAWKEIMREAHKQRGENFTHISTSETDFSFHDMLSRLVSGTIFDEDDFRRPNRASGPEQTPLGRHQWDFND